MTDDKDLDQLGALVKARFDKAREAKKPHHADMVECLKLMNGQSLTKAAKGSPDIVLDVTSPIVKGIIGLIRDIFGASSVAAPYTINASPIAELPPDVEQDMINKVQADLEVMVALSGGDIAAVRHQITELRSVLMIEENRKAALAAERMTNVIADRLHDANWENEFIDFIENFVIYPAAIMKAPSIKEQVRLKWTGSTVAPVRDIVRQVECISPFDFYPAPYAQDIQSAEYVIERRRLTRNELLALRSAPGYHADTIDEIFEDAPDGSPLAYDTSDENPTADTYNVDGKDRDIYDALGYYGRIRNDLLTEYGIEFTEAEMTAASEAEVWVVNGRVIKCLLNPDKAGMRPFYKASFERVPGAFWGMSPAMKLRDVQKTCTGAARALVRNMAFSSGPFGEVDKSRIKDGEDPRVIAPNSLRVVGDDNGLSGGRPAYTFHSVPAHADLLFGVFDKFHALGYELIGIPRVAFGGTQGLGTVGRTSGGMSIVMNQSTKALKHALRMLEKGLVEPVVQDFINYELQTTDDPELRGDIRVYARGVSGLMEQEHKNSDLEWALQSISPMVGQVDPQTGQPIVPASAVQRLLYQIFKNKGISTNGIFPDFDRQEALGEIMDSAGGAQPNEVVDMPRMDGRNADAANAIDNANGVI